MRNSNFVCFKIETESEKFKLLIQKIIILLNKIFEEIINLKIKILLN